MSIHIGMSENPTRKINAYVTLGDLMKQRADLRGELLSYLPDKDRYVDPEHRALLDKLGMTEFQTPTTQQALSQIQDPMSEIPDWYPNPKVDKMSPGYVARSVGMFVNEAWKQTLDMGKAAVSPTSAKQQYYYQMKDLMKRHATETDPDKSQELLKQIYAISPYMHNQYLATLSSAGQTAILALAVVPKLALGLKALVTGEKVMAETKGAIMMKQFQEAMKKQGLGAKATAAGKVVGGAYEGIGLNPKFWNRQAEMMLDPWVKAQVINLAVNNINDFDPKNVSQTTKDILYNLAEDPLGTIMTGHMAFSTMKSGGHVGGKFKDTKAAKLSGNAEQVAASVVSDVKREKPPDMTPATQGAVDIGRQDVMNKFADYRSKLSTQEIKIDPEVDKKIFDVIDGTKRSETISDFNRMLIEDPENLSKAMAGDTTATQHMLAKYDNPEIRHVFDKGKRSIDGILKSFGDEIRKRANANEFVAQYLDKEGKNRMTEFDNEYQGTVDKWKAGEIKMDADEFLSTTEMIKDKAVDYMTGKNLSIRDVFDPFYNEIARDTHEIKTRVENELEPKVVIKTELDGNDRSALRQLGFDEAKIAEMGPIEAGEILRKHKAGEIPKGMTPDEIYKEAEITARENVRNIKGSIGLTSRDITRDIIEAINNIFIRDADTKMKKFDKPMKNLIKQEIINTIKENAKGITDPIKYVEKMHDILEKVYDGKVSIIGLEPAAWQKMIEGIRAGTIKESDLTLALQMAEHYKINPGTAIRMNPNAALKEVGSPNELPEVFRLLNEINEEVIKKGPSAKYYHKLIRIAKTRESINEAKELGSNVKEKLKQFIDSADTAEKQQLKTDADEIQTQLNHLTKLEWRGRQLDNTNLEDVKTFMKEVMSTKRMPEKGVDLDPSLVKDFEPALEAMANADDSILRIRAGTKFQKEVLASLKLHSLDWYVRGVDFHLRPELGKDLGKLEDFHELVKKTEKKKGKQIDELKVRDYMDGRTSIDDLNLWERKTAKLHRAFYDKWGKFKEIFPEFHAVENYMRRPMLESYFKTTMALKNDIIPNWWKGQAEAEEAWRARHQYADSEIAKIKNSRSLSYQEKGAKIDELNAKYAEIDARYEAYSGTRQDFIDTIRDRLDQGRQSNRIDQEMYEGAINELETKGMVDGPNISKAMERIDYVPDYVKNRIAAGLEPRNDIVNHYAAMILREGGFPLEKIRNLPPVSVLRGALMEAKRLKKATAVPAYYDKGSMVDWVRNLSWGFYDKKISEPKMNAIKKIMEYDRLETSLKDLLPFMAEGGKLDPTLINRVHNNLMYKAGGLLDEARNYAGYTLEGLRYSPVARVLNTLKDHIRGSEFKKYQAMPKEVVNYIENVATDITGGDWATDRMVKGAILKGPNNIVGELVMKHYARKAGISNAEIYWQGERPYVRGNFFDPHSNTVMEGIEGILAEDILPKRMAMRVINNLKMVSYMSLLGLSPRSTLMNMLQPQGPMSYWQKSTAGGLLPAMSTIRAGFTSYQKALGELLNPVELKKLKRSGMVAEALTMAMEGYSADGKGWFKKMGEITLSNMTATEYLNRTAMMEYWKELNKDTIKAMDLNVKQVEMMAWDFSNKSNFKFDALSQPQFLRTTMGKVLGHLGTFAFNQIKLFADETKKGVNSIPDVWHQVKKCHTALWTGNWEGFKKEFNTLNNVQRLGVVRYMLATGATVSMMNAMFGWSMSGIMWNRTLQFPGTENPLIQTGMNLYGVMTGDKHPRELGNIAYGMLPLGSLMKKIGKAYEKNDLGYLIHNSMEIIPGVDIKPEGVQ